MLHQFSLEFVLIIILMHSTTSLRLHSSYNMHETKSHPKIQSEHLQHQDQTNKNIKKLQSRLEEQDMSTLQRKWDSMMAMNVSGKTLEEIPQDWLSLTIGRNVTYNSTDAKSHLARKLASLIEKHLIKDQVKKQSTAPQKTANRHGKVHLVSTFKDKVKNVATKVKNELNKNKTEEGDESLREYPGKNKTARSNLFKQWKTYYQCLEGNTSFIPKVHYAFPGESIKLICRACFRPGHIPQINWHLATAKTNNKEMLLGFWQKGEIFNSNTHIFISNGGSVLNIYGVNERDAGNYSCRQYDTLLSVHLLQVAHSTENATKVWPDTVQGKPHAAPEVILPNLGLIVTTKWKNWTSCSQCGQVGKRFRVGTCTVQAVQIRSALKVLDIFPEGLPCLSKLLPKFVQNHPTVKNRNSEIMEAFCKEPCPKEEKYIVRDEKGQVVEEADNAKGVYSMFQKLPNLPPPIKRKILFLKQWDTAYIQCPGSLRKDMPPRWFVRDQPIYSKGDRIYVTPSHMLVVEELGLSDSNLYSCWQGGKLVGTIRLVVSQPVRLSFSQQISAISMVLIVATFVIIFGRSFCNALRANQQK